MKQLEIFTFLLFSRTVQSLDALVKMVNLRPGIRNLPLTPDVVLGQVQVRSVTLVVGEHDGAPHVGVLQPKRVPELMNGHLGQVDPSVAPEGPELVVVEVNVS